MALAVSSGFIARTAEEKLAAAAAVAAAARDRLRLQTTHFSSSLDFASGLACLPNGCLCVSDTGNHRLLVLSPESGDVLSTFGKGGGNLVVASPDATHAERRDLKHQRSRNRCSHDSAGLRGPKGLVVDQDAIYVADCYNSCVKKFSLRDGSILGIAGSYGVGEGQLRYPHGLALAQEDGALYVSDSGNARVCVFSSSDMKFKFQFRLHRGATQAGKDLERMERALDSLSHENTGSASVSSGTSGSSGVGTSRQYAPAPAPSCAGTSRKVSDSVIARLGVKWMGRATPAGPATKSGNGAGNHDAHPRASLRPSGMAIVDHEIFVCDHYSRRIQVFSLKGEFSRHLMPKHPDGTEKGKPMLVSPQGIAASNGRLYVTDRRGDALHMLAAADGRPEQTVPFLVNRPRGLGAVCTDGVRVFVADELKSQILVLNRQEIAKPTHGTPRSALGSARTADKTPRAGSAPRPGSTPRTAGTPFASNTKHVATSSEGQTTETAVQLGDATCSVVEDTAAIAAARYELLFHVERMRAAEGLAASRQLQASAAIADKKLGVNENLDKEQRDHVAALQATLADASEAIIEAGTAGSLMGSPSSAMAACQRRAQHLESPKRVAARQALRNRSLRSGSLRSSGSVMVDPLGSILNEATC